MYYQRNRRNQMMKECKMSHAQCSVHKGITSTTSNHMPPIGADHRARPPLDSIFTPTETQMYELQVLRNAPPSEEIWVDTHSIHSITGNVLFFNFI